MYRRRDRGWLKHLDFIFWDVISLQIALALAYYLRTSGGIVYSSDEYLELAMFMMISDILIAAAFNTMHNVMKRGLLKEVGQSIKQGLFVLLAASLYMFAVKSGAIYSRLAIFFTAVFHVILGYLMRILWKPAARRLNRSRRKPRMILIADEKRIPEINAGLGSADRFEPAGIILTNRNAAGEEIDGVKVVADMADAADYICREWVDEVFICPESMSELETGVQDDPKIINAGKLVEQCREMFLPVHIRFPITDLGGKSVIEKVGDCKVLTMTSNYAYPFELTLKRLLDIFGGLVGSIIAVLVIIAVTPILKIESPGPVLFKQTRIGRNGKKFQVYKLRTMYMDAEERKKELMKENKISDGMMFKMDWDPRIIGNKIVDGKQITGIFSRIRELSLDEFPNFFNVLLNQMSLVGTRPPTVDEWEKYKYHHRARMAFKPGITGMWQISGRSSITDFEEVVRLDTEYINNWSIGLDIKILFKTVRAVLKRDGAM